MTLLESAYNALNAAGVDVRLATRHSGTCDAPYCVIYEGQPEIAGKTLVKRHIMVDALTPAARPQDLQALCGDIRTALWMGPMLSFAGASSDMALEDYRAVGRTMDFTALCGADI